MTVDASSSSIFSPWPDRLRHSAIVLLTAGLALAALVLFGELSLLRALTAFACIAGAALVPWRLHHVAASRAFEQPRVERAAGLGPFATADERERSGVLGHAADPTSGGSHTG